MGRAYSQDLRERVLAAVDGGMTKMGAHQTFRVWRSTIDDWLALRAATGALVPQSPARKGPPRLLDEESFVSFAQAHRHDTLEAMALARWRLRGRNKPGARSTAAPFPSRCGAWGGHIKKVVAIRRAK